MRAAQYLDGVFTVADVPAPPAVGPGQLRISVAACGICGSDLSMSKDPCRFVGVAAAAGYPLATFDTARLPFNSRIQVLAAGFAEEPIVPVVAQFRRIAVNFGHGPYADPYDITLTRLARGEIDAEAILTGRVGLDGVADAFTALRAPGNM